MSTHSATSTSDVALDVDPGKQLGQDNGIVATGKNYDLSQLESQSAVHGLSAAIRESTDSLIKAMGAPRTTIGIASALGLFAFAVPNFINAMWQTGIWNIDPTYAFEFTGPAMLAAVFVAFIGQFLAGLWNLTKGDTFGAVAMGGYGLFWAGYWWYLEFGLSAFLTSYFQTMGRADLIAACTAAGNVQLALSNPAACIAARPSILVGFNRQAGLFLGYYAIPWLVLTSMFLLCSLRMALLECWIFFVVDMVFVCVVGMSFSYPGTSAFTGWQKALGVWSLILFMTAMYFVFAILFNQTYNAPLLPLGHTRPIIMNWPHEFGSAMHQQTHRNLHLYLPEQQLRRAETSDHGQGGYDAEHEARRTDVVAGHRVPEKQV